MPKNVCLLSVAMIMKDEAHNLDRALRSIKPFVDEIVVVDTGSKDESVEIAKKYTDRIYFYEWNDDFSAARNFSLQYPTCEWVLIYDADEEVKEDFEGIREFLSTLPNDVNTVYLPTISYLDWDLKKIEVASTARIFRNGTVQYKNIVHNQPVFKGKVVEAPFPIYHYGYIWTRKLKQKKYDRTKTLLVRMLEKDLDIGEKLYYLCQLYKTESIYGKKEEQYRIFNDIYKLVLENKIFSNIAFEVFFIHAMELHSKGLYETAHKLLDFSLKVNSKNPDTYYGLLALAEAKDDYQQIIEYGEKFLQEIDEVMNSPEKYPWTIISIKYVASARTLLAIAYLKMGNIDKFREHLHKIADDARRTGENIEKFLKSLFETLLNVEDNAYLTISEEIDFVLGLIKENNVNVEIRKLLEKDLQTGRKIRVDLYEPFVSSRYEKLLLIRLLERKDLLLEYFLGEDPVEGVKRFGVGALIFFFEHSLEDQLEKLKFLNEIRKTNDVVLKGVSLALIGDIYLKLKQYKLSLDYYRRSIEVLPEIAKFIKPVLEDLKSKLDPDVDGVFEEIKNYFTKNKEFFCELPKEFNTDELKRMYLLSDSDFAKYVAAVFSDSKSESVKLLDQIRQVEKFPFYYYRKAKLVEDSNDPKLLEEAFQLHMKACRVNPNLGDIKLGIYPYDGFYLTDDTHLNEKDPVLWVGNISEKHSGLGVISPVRMWKEGKGYIYVVPFPVDEALKVYKERLRKFKLPRPAVGKEDLLEVLSESNLSDVFLPEDEKDYEEMLKAVAQELGIKVVSEKTSKAAVVSFEALNTKIDLGRLLSQFSKGVMFYFIPDFSDRDNIVWYYPYFRVFRTRLQIDELLRGKGFSRIRHVVLSGQLRAVLFEE